jgi:hypothetical protein
MQHPLDFSETLYYVRRLTVGSHSIFFYKTPSEKRAVIFNFLQAGLEHGEGAIYIASEETSQQIRRHMKDFGLDVTALERDGALRVVDYDGWYLVDGKVQPSYTLMLVQRVLKEAMEMGLKGLRGCGEATCFFDHHQERALVDYELMIGKRIDLPATVLCAYEVNQAKSLEGILFFNLMKAHGPVITRSFAREVCFEHLFSKIVMETLATVFGDAGKETILRMLEERLSLQADNIVDDPKDFVESLEILLGSGAQLITKSVVKQIHSTMGITD